jgi:hypothetical protein
MTVKLNQAAFEHAIHLIDHTDYRLNTVWAGVAPTEAQTQRFQTAHGDDALHHWYLGIDENGTYVFPYGDLKSLHRSGVVSAHKQATAAGYTEIADAAMHLLDLLDRANAC